MRKNISLGMLLFVLVILASLFLQIGVMAPFGARKHGFIP